MRCNKKEKKKETTYLNKENLNNNEIDKNDFSSPF